MLCCAETIIIKIIRHRSTLLRFLRIAKHEPCKTDACQGQRDWVRLHLIGNRATHFTTMFAELVTDLAHGDAAEVVAGAA